MGGHRRTQEPGDDSLDASVVVDAGGDGPDRLVAALHRRLRELAVDQVMEVITPQAESHATLLAWCRLTSQSLVRARQDGAQLHFWIRKARPLTGEEELPPVLPRNERSMR